MREPFPERARGAVRGLPEAGLRAALRAVTPSTPGGWDLHGLALKLPLCEVPGSLAQAGQRPHQDDAVLRLAHWLRAPVVHGR